MLKYVMVVTSEDKRYTSGEVGLDFFSNHPWEGLLVDIVSGNSFEELYGDGKHEGLFYQLYETSEGYRIGSGTLDPDAPREEVREWEHRCRRRQAKNLWMEFGDVPMNPETEEIEEKWQDFPAGTHREDIWHWFEEKFNLSVAEDLMGCEAEMP